MNQMHHSIIQEHSSCETASYSEKSPFCYIVLDVYFTSILRDLSLMNSEASIVRRRIKLLENCSIMCHKESGKVIVSSTKRDTAKLMVEGYFIVAEVKLHRKENGKHVFSLQKRTKTDDGYNQLKKEFAQGQINNQNSSVFYSVKTDRTQSENQQIKHNDLIKFGKEVYLAKIYSHKDQKKSIRMAELAPIEQKTKFQSKNNTGECKICMVGEGQCEKDYIVSPCRCSGTCSSVHVECLKNWIACKIEVRKNEEKLLTYDMSRFQCEICKQKYPEALQIDESLVEISPEIEIKDDTLFLTKIYPIEGQKKVCHKVSLSKGDSLSVGRHYYNELILEDMSISRNHAEINRAEDSKFYLYDKNARFGTFVNLKSPVQNLNEAILLTSKQTFRFRLLEEEPVDPQNPPTLEEYVSQESIEY